MNTPCTVAAGLVALCAAFGPAPARGASDPLDGLVSANGGAGLGLEARLEQSPYRGGGTRYDLVPLYLYEGEHVYLHAYRAGLKFDLRRARRFDVFLAHRFEGFPYDRMPSSLAGMTGRDPEGDLGLRYEERHDWGDVFGEVLHDISGVSLGDEGRLGYSYTWRTGSLWLTPVLTLAARDARLNNYYYGVRPSEAMPPERPAYQPGSGFNSTVGINVRYDLTERWKLLAGLSATRWGSGVRHSPIVDDRIQFAGFAAFAYDFTPEKPAPPPEREPLIVKLLHGKSTDCNLLPIMRLGCTSTGTVDRTGVDAIEIGRPFIERANDWPLDFVGYISFLRHDEHDLQRDFWQFSAYMKAYYYGFPWSEKVRTRIGFGAGISYAQQVPFVEARDQALRGRNTSKLLQYLDPSIDVSVGDVFGVRSLHETYFGFGVSHRSGIFGTSQLLGNVNGGSNYIYSYIEWRM